MSQNNIPSREESQDLANKQEFIEGARKEIDVEDYEEVSSLGQLLKNLTFPAGKEQILNHVKKMGRAELISKLTKTEDKQYANVSEVAKSSGIVRGSY